MAAADGLPMPSTKFLAPSRQRQDGEADIDDVLHLIRSIRLRSEASAATDGGDAVTTIMSTSSPSLHPKRKPPQGWDYDAAIDATLRATERDPAERPSPDYLRVTQAGTEGITEADRAEFVEEMHDFCRHHGLPVGTPHRAAAYVDRFLSARKLGVVAAGEEKLWILGAAAKYEDQCRLDVVGASEAATPPRTPSARGAPALVAALGYRLGGPTAHTFVDHFTRHLDEENEEEVAETVRSLAHHLADMALLSYRCVAFLPSAVAVAASAILLPGLVRGYCSAVPPVVAGYTMEELSECVDAIYDVHEYALALPGGCSWMMADWEATHGSCSLAPRSTLTCVEVETFISIKKRSRNTNTCCC